LSVADDRTVFYAQEFTAYEVLPLELFNKQVQLLTSVFSKSTKDIFVRSLDIIRRTTQDNLLASGYSTNLFPYTTGNWSYPTLEIASAFYPSSSYTCICIFSSSCTEPIIVSYIHTIYFDYYYTDNQTVLFQVLPGLLKGCFIQEATLQSTLECFYNQSCLDATYSYFGLMHSANFTALNSTVPSRFNATSIISDLITEMMVEEWTYKSSHSSFYNVCRPLFCSYSFVGKNNLSVIISIAIGLIGGLNTILMLIVPQSIKFLRRCRKRSIFQLMCCNHFISFLKPIALIEHNNVDAIGKV
jgi:hypothetical protein